MGRIRFSRARAADRMRRRGRLSSPGIAGGKRESRRQLALYAQGFALMGGFVAMYNFLTFRLETSPSP